MTNTEAAMILRDGFMRERRRVIPDYILHEAMSKAITALEHQPEPQTEPQETGRVRLSGLREKRLERNSDKDSGLECNVCHWRTLDTHRLLCDSCGGHELKPVYEVGK
jgi:hypothetical protein